MPTIWVCCPAGSTRGQAQVKIKPRINLNICVVEHHGCSTVCQFVFIQVSRDQFRTTKDSCGLDYSIYQIGFALYYGNWPSLLLIVELLTKLLTKRVLGLWHPMGIAFPSKSWSPFKLQCSHENSHNREKGQHSSFQRCQCCHHLCTSQDSGKGNVTRPTQWGVDDM